MKKSTHIIATVTGIYLLANPTNAYSDISVEWQKQNELKQRYALACQQKWDQAQFADVTYPGVLPRSISTHPHRWILTPSTASRISLYGRRADQCFQMGAEKIGVERRTQCFESALYLVPDKEAKRSRLYECITLLRFEQSELIEYRKSERFGLEKRVVGIPLPTPPVLTPQ